MAIVRRALIDSVVRAGRIVAIVGPAGSGKTTLVGQVGLVAGSSVVRAAVEPQRTGADDVRRALLRGLQDAGIPSGGGEDPLAVLAEIPIAVMVMFDDVHHLAADDASALVELIDRIQAPHRVLVVGRVLPAALAACAEVVIDDAQIRLAAHDLAALVYDAADQQLPAVVLKAIHRASGGLIGPAALLATSVTSGRLRPDQVSSPTGSVAAAIADAVDRLADDRREVMADLARLRLLIDGLDRALGAPGLLDELRQVGLPVHHVGNGRWELDDWVRDRIARPGRLDAAIAAVASRHYRAVGEISESVAVLLDAGRAEAAADLLGALSFVELDGLDLVDVEALVARMPRQTIDDHPDVRWLQAHLSADVVLIANRVALLDALLADDLPPALRRKVSVERARDLARDGSAAEADAIADEILDHAAPDELWTRAAALEVKGRAAAWGADSIEALDHASRHFDAALALVERLHSADMHSSVLGFAGYRVDVPAGRLDRGAARLWEAADLISGRPRRRAMLLTFAAEVDHLRGDMTRAAQALDEADVVAQQLGDHRLHAYVAWERARGAGLQGRTSDLRAHIATVERHASEWFEHPSGMVFLADMADLFDRVGEPVDARRLLDRALERMAELGADDPDPLIVALALEARRGDAHQALLLAERIEATGQLAPIRVWRVQLLRARAAQRLGDPLAAELAARAIEHADRLGVIQLVSHLEPEASAALRELAVLAGSAAATRMSVTGNTTEVQVLGGFGVTRGGKRIDLPPGHPVRLVKFLAGRGGRAHIESIIDALWPESDAAGGRKLLRNVLSRLNTAVDGALVVRDGDILTLADDCEIDATEFAQRARRALEGGESPGPLVHARLAAAAYRGDLLPDDLYDDWAIEPRRVLRAQAVGVLTLLAQHAIATGDVDGAVRHLERVIAVDPLGADHYVTLSRVLSDAGRHAAADRALADLARVLD